MSADWIVFSFDRKDDFPVILGKAFDFKEENVRRCNSTLVMEGENYYTVHRKVDKNIDLLMTYSISPFNFIRGYVYANGKEYNIVKTARYASLQIGNYCHDNVCVVQVDTNIFTDTKKDQLNNI
uniref:Uncharacterized protein n=1 Tax=viral metagenome TaxID=1070528 RepID=A0A6C0JMC8_9ZZZZ